MTDVIVELRAANPAPADADSHPTAWSDTALLAEIDTRSGTDMSLDQKPKTERARAVEAPRKWNRWLVAAAAFAVVIGVIGVVSFIGGGPDTTEPPVATSVLPEATSTTVSVTTTASLPQEEAALTPTQVGFVESYFEAWNSDADAYLAFFTPDATAWARGGISGRSDDNLGQYAWDVFVDRTRWQVAVGTQLTVDVDRCLVRSAVIVCPFSLTDPFIERTLLRIDGVLNLFVSAGQIERQEVLWGNAVAGNVLRAMVPFSDWLGDNYPDSAPLMTTGNEPVYTLESAQLWLQLVPRYFGLDAPLNAEETAFVVSFFDAWNTDVEAYLGLFDPDAEIGKTNASKYGPWVSPPGTFEVVEWDDFVAFSRWERWFGTTSIVNPGACAFRSDQLVCPFTTTDPFIEATLLRLQAVATFELSQGSVSRLEISWTSSANGDADVFQRWLKDEHPEIEREMILDSAQPVPTERSAQLWIEYIPLYVESTRG